MSESTLNQDEVQNELVFETTYVFLHLTIKSIHFTTESRCSGTHCCCLITCVDGHFASELREGCFEEISLLYAM